MSERKPSITSENYIRLLPRQGRDRDRYKDTGRGGVAGLTLLVTAAGSRRWAYVYKDAQRRKVFLSLGSAKDLTLAEARISARGQRALRDQGKDPREQRRIARVEHRRQVREVERLESETLAAAVSAYIKANGAEWSPVTLKERERMAGTYVSTMPSCSVSVSVVRPFEVEHDLKQLRPIQANRVRSLLLAASRWAVRKERISRDVMSATDRPTRKENKRARVLSDEEVRDLWRGHVLRPAGDCPTIPVPVLAYLKLLLLCGTRRGETGKADWKDIDLAARLWSVPGEARKGRHHARQPLAVPLSAAAVGLLRALRPRKAGRVFPARIAACPGRTMTTVRAALAIKKDSDRDFTLHDLRRTFATGLQRLGVPLPVITAALGQTPSREAGTGVATAVYARHDYLEERQNAMESWAQHIDAVVAATTAPPTSTGRALPRPRAAR